MSSTRIATCRFSVRHKCSYLRIDITLSRTSPTKTSIFSSWELTFLLARCLWIRANSMPSLSAMAVTLDVISAQTVRHTAIQTAHRFAPPASGLTMIPFFQSGILRLM